MTANPALSLVNPEFDDFLFALVGEQENGMPVSIFSALARLDIDPWREAKRLTDMPKDRAAQALRESIDRLIGLKRTKTEGVADAARLIRLLPSRGVPMEGWVKEAAVARQARVTAASGIVARATNLPVWVWLAVALAVMATAYVTWSGAAPALNQNYDNPVLEQRR